MLKTIVSIPARTLDFLQKDGRHSQIIYQLIFMSFGLAFLGWDTEWFTYLIFIGTCLFAQAIMLKYHGKHISGLKSAMISALSLCLMVKVNMPWTAVIVALLTILSKYFIRYKGKHVFNPTNFGILMAILLTGDAWLSPGQWGNQAIFLFSLGITSMFVLFKVGRIDTGVSFILAYGGLQFARQVLYLGWPIDHFIHQMSSGTLLLFAFFMVTDPMTTPNHKKARILWALGIGAFAFFLTNWFYVHTAPLWALFIAAPFTVVLDHYFKAKKYEWKNATLFKSINPDAIGTNLIKQQNLSIMKSLKKLTALFMMIMVVNQASAFCGFYVAKADAKLFNESSQVIIARDGNNTVITMSNDFKGSVEDFAMVVPVPEVLKEHNIRVTESLIFDKLDAYSGPRLVEYHDNNPCYEYALRRESLKMMSAAPTSVDKEEMLEVMEDDMGVTIEATYTVGEYDILILSATESQGLKKWLLKNGYKIPASAHEVLDPYIKDDLKFFVVKVNLEEQKKSGAQTLRPIQIAFTSERFMLPIRLGMANANGPQDMIVYTLTKKGRVETANYRTVAIPSNKNIPEFLTPKFGKFYASVFDRAWAREGKDIAMVEYAWDLSSKNFVKCDPCATTPPVYKDLREAGAFWVTDQRYGSSNYTGDVFFTRLHVRYDRQHFPQDLMFVETPNKTSFQGRYVMQHMVQGNLTCDNAQDYYKQVLKRRQGELGELASLTGWNTSEYDFYLAEVNKKIVPKKGGWIEPNFSNDKGSMSLFLLLGIFMSLGIGSYLGKNIFKSKEV